MLEEKIRTFGNKIFDIMMGKNLTREEAKEMFSQVLLNEQPDLQQGAFLAALTIKGPTPEEIAGSWEAIYELDTVKVMPMVSQPLVENCGTGMDTLKTFNISTAAAVVAAANGIYMAKHGARAITSKCGAIDILESVGVDVECDVEIVKKSIEKAGIGIFNGMSSKVHPQALYRILSQIRFGTILNIAASLANPALPHYGVRGVYSKELVKPTAQTMREIGYKRAIVIYGLNEDGTKGMDEISSVGETMIAELYESGEITAYTITPEDVGIQRTNEHVLRPSSDRKEEALSFLRILSGKDKGPKFETVCLNVAPILYMMGKAKDIKDGLSIAKETIETGQAIIKLKEWVREQNSNPEFGEKKLNSLLEQINAHL
ncbi:MAG: anthranilate phosphoribosyltransferase [archaeon]|nr:anthranilate phosphoribosyltransferase [archaeon]MCP8313797.1 anthranilate phosphoribosyltransferase [archaeon]